MSRKGSKWRYGRYSPVRDYRKAVLIVCEGSVTEPYYFRDLCEYLGLERFHIQIEKGKHGLTPIGVVNKAFEKDCERTELSKEGPGMVEFDQIWCVFDRDQHRSIKEALAEINRLNRVQNKYTDDLVNHEPRFYAAYSDPCFEYWLLLHFVETTSQFENCKKVIKELKNYIRYTKSKFEIDKILPETDNAVSRVKIIR
ncbi:RloB domain-containing protein, partial [bacterium]|nr:RloB domain-containing protein [bacterium]